MVTGKVFILKCNPCVQGKSSIGDFHQSKGQKLIALAEVSDACFINVICVHVALVYSKP